MKQSVTAPFEITTPQRALDVGQAKRPRSARSTRALSRNGSTKAEQQDVVSEIHRGLHLAVLAVTMRVQGFSERSIDLTTRHAARMLDVFQVQGVQVAAPKVFDPRAPSLRARASSGAPEHSATRELERTPSEPAVFSR